jgi:hypothetical protein
MADSTSTKIIQYVGEMSNIFRQLDQLEAKNRKLAGTLSTDANKGFQTIGTGLGKITQQFKLDPVTKELQATGIATQSFSENIKDADGNLSKFTSTTKTSADGTVTVNKSFTDLDKNTVSLGENMARLAKRAALTIPLWLVLRGAVTGVISTFKNGIKDIVDFDRALQKLRRNISAISTDLDKDFGTAKDVIIAFSRESGRSVEEITNAIQKFATVGFTLDESLAGGLASTKLAVTLFGDVENTANAFARTLRVMSENMSDSEEKQKAINEALAFTDQLWKTNAFEVNEFSHNLEQFASTANIANISISDTLALLATLSTGGLANRAGRLLRSTLLKSLSDIDKINQSLQLGFDPKKQSTTEFILLLVGALKQIKTQKNVPAELADTLGELFAIRGTEVAAALTALQKTLKENLALRPDVQKFNDEFKEQTETINGLVKRYTNLNKEIGRAFVNGIVGGEDFAKSLEKIVKVQEQLLSGAERFGLAIRNSLAVSTIALLGFQAQAVKLFTFLSATTANPFLVTIALSTLALDFKKQANDLAKEAETQSRDFDTIGQKIGKSINAGLKRTLTLDELRTLIIELETFGATGLKLDVGQFDRTLTVLKQIRSEEEAIAKTNTEQNTQNQQDEISDGNRLKIQELILKNKIDQLKADGLRESTILTIENTLLKQFGLEQDTLSVLERQLGIEREKSNEQRLQSELGNESLKLFRIAQEQGTDIAKKIGDVLSGDVDFSAFIRRGGEAADIFKKEFSDLFEQQQATQFFRGQRVSGASDLRGGSRINIAEDLGTGNREVINAQLEVARAIDKFQSIERVFSPNTSATDRNTQAIIENTQKLTGFDRLKQIAGTGNNIPALTDPLRQKAAFFNSVPPTPSKTLPFEMQRSVVNIDGVNVTIMAKTFEDRDKQIEFWAEEIKKQAVSEIKNKLVGKQSNSF